MPNANLIVDPDNWIRAGRGLSIQFFATSSDVRDWLATALPTIYNPFSVIGISKVKKHDRTYVDKLYQASLEKYLDDLESGNITETQDIWLYSMFLTPKLEEHRGIWSKKFFSFNGFINMQSGLMVVDYRDSKRPKKESQSSIGMVNRIRNVINEAIIDHKSYVHIYQCIQNSVKQSLVYSSIHSDKDGHQIEDTRHVRWTERAVQKWIQGHPFWSSPGNEIPRKH